MIPDKKTKLSTESYKGVRDFFPVDMAIEKKIFDIWRGVCEKFGYEEYGASVLEPAELYRAKSGEEIVNEQTYTFIDRGDREVTLRPEMTPTVARMVAARKRELVFPLRWYSIPNLFRYENPQRGRLREHWQLNVDIFGVEGIQADVEAVSVAYHIMKAFGAKDSDFEIRINSRMIVNHVLQEIFGLDGDTAKKLLKLNDKKNKMTPKVFEAAVRELLGAKADAILNFGMEDFKKAPAYESIAKTISQLEKLGVGNIIFDPSISRGFDYYTGMVFEIFDTNPANSRSLFGGGRYDNLTSLFGGDKVSAVGFGMGDVTMRDFLETHDLLKKLEIPASADYYICVVSPTEASAAMKLADELRNKGSRVAIDFSYKKIGDQIKNADKRGIIEVIVIGEDEAKTGNYKIKNLKTGKSVDLSLAKETPLK